MSDLVVDDVYYSKLSTVLCGELGNVSWKGNGVKLAQGDSPLLLLLLPSSVWIIRVCSLCSKNNFHCAVHAIKPTWSLLFKRLVTSSPEGCSR